MGAAANEADTKTDAGYSVGPVGNTCPLPNQKAAIFRMPSHRMAAAAYKGDTKRILAIRWGLSGIHRKSSQAT